MDCLHYFKQNVMKQTTINSGRNDNSYWTRETYSPGAFFNKEILPESRTGYSVNRDRIFYYKEKVNINIIITVDK